MSRRGLRTIRPAGAAVAAGALLALPLSAQVSVGGGFTLESYTFDEPGRAGFEELTLTTMPFGATVDVVEGVAVSVGGAWARGEMTLQDESTLTISGLTDTSLGVSWTLGRDLLTLSGVVFLPTGQAGLTVEESGVAGAVAYDLLPTRVSNWGTEGGGDVSVALAVPLGDAVSVGARVGYRIVPEHEPFEEGFQPFGDIDAGAGPFVYDPGDQLYVRGALDANLSRASKLSLSVTHQTFSEDASEATNIFRSGDRTQGMLSLVFPVGVGSGWLFGGALHRAEGEFLELLADEIPRSSQNVFFAGIGARLLLAGVGFVPVAEARGLQADDGFGQGWTVGVGASLEIPLGDGPALVPMGRYRWGTLLVSDDLETDFTGYEIGISLRGLGR